MVSTGFTVSKGREYLLEVCGFIGLDVFLQDGKKTLSYYLCFWIPGFYQLCCLYSFYILRDDPVTILKCLSLWGAAGQCNIKVNMAYLHRKKYRELFDFIKRHQLESEDDHEINKIFWCANKTSKSLLKFIMILFNMTMVMMGSYPLLNFLVYGQRKFVVICNIPGLNPDPEAGFPDYEIQTIIHLVCLFVGSNELAVLEGVFAYFVLNGACVADSLIIHVRRMSSLLITGSLTDDTTTEYIRRLIHLHQDYIAYVKNLDRMYSLMYFLQFGTYALSGSVGLYAARISDWYAVYWIVVCNSFQLFFACAMGSIIERKNSQIADELYNAHWTEMSVKNRRMVLFMIHRSKTQSSIMVGKIAKLNLETGMDIYKILYSYSVILKDAVNA